MRKSAAFIAVVFIAACVVGVTRHNYAASEDKYIVLIDSITKRVEKLEENVKTLDALVHTDRWRNYNYYGYYTPYSGYIASEIGWKDAANWRLLTVGLDRNRVRSLLGAPGNVVKGSWGETWQYRTASAAG
ncbi:MAG: hypothetical protein ABIH66_05360 [bacterium]